MAKTKETKKAVKSAANNNKMKKEKKDAHKCDDHVCQCC